jgi:hypothetical protein
MGSGVHICALLAGLTPFAGWALSRFTLPRRVGWVNLLSGVGILAFFFSIPVASRFALDFEFLCAAALAPLEHI